MIDNLEGIKGILSFGEFDFYMIQIIKRKKDIPDLKRNSMLIRSYYVDSFEYLTTIYPHIKKQCDDENARAYIRLNKRNYKSLSLKLMSRSIAYISSNNYKSLPNAFDSVAGEFHSDPDKKWLIDLDPDTIDSDIEIQFQEDGGVNKLGFVKGGSQVSKINLLAVMLQHQTKKEPMGLILPSKYGAHIITRPFNLKKFKEVYPKIDIHKDATVILYCP